MSRSIPPSGDERSGSLPHVEAASADAGLTLSAGDLYFGDSYASRKLLAAIQMHAQTPFPVLLLGDTGTGKTAVARYIHIISPRRAKPFISLSLPSIPEELRHTAIAGYRRGSFTGAVDDRPGALEAASEGTLFLDELGHASVRLQQLLLGVLETGAVRRVGEMRERRVDVRFVFATSADLPALCSKGEFLSALYFRVEGFIVRVPTLRERRDDILPLARLFLAEALRELHKPFAVSFSPELETFLQNAPWRGNIRQLKSTCRFIAMRLDHERAADLGDLSEGMIDPRARSDRLSRRDQALDVLQRAGGNKSKAAKLLGVSRTAFYRLLEGRGSQGEHPTPAREVQPELPSSAGHDRPPDTLRPDDSVQTDDV